MNYTEAVEFLRELRASAPGAMLHDCSWFYLTGPVQGNGRPAMPYWERSEKKRQEDRKRYRGNKSLRLEGSEGGHKDGGGVSE